MSLMNRQQLAAQIVERTCMAASHRRIGHFAAVRIQSAWHGYQTRQYIVRLNRAATLIQSTFRGYRQRRRYALLLELTAQQRIERHFNRHATCIQRWWRGYRSRRQHFDNRQLRQWLSRLHDKSAELAAETSAYFADERSRKASDQEQRARKLCMRIARKLHHLLRTHQRSGIYSRRQPPPPPAVRPADGGRPSTAQTQIERLLVSLRFREFNQRQSAERTADRHLYLEQRERLYANSADAAAAATGTGTLSRCEAHYRWRDMDAAEARTRLARRATVEAGASGDWRSAIRPTAEPYRRQLMATVPYCDNIMAMSREYEILTPDRDFCLNRRIVERPERIEQFLTVLHDYCMAHHLVKK